MLQWRDTIIIPGGRAKVRIRFKPDALCGDMVVHCHTLYHGDRGMMQTLRIGKSTNSC
jgi:FtsP/CotA-like multicopper oxidase with cupredoxin domain